MKAVSTIVRILARAVYVIIIAALLIAAPIVFGYRPVVVLSGSMLPHYPVGSVTYYKPTDLTGVGVGDVITFSIGEGSLATHRVVDKDETNQSFMTKGDNNPSADSSPVPFDKVRGKTMNFAVPYAGYLFTYVKNNWALIVVLGAILLADMLLPSPKKQKKDRAPENTAAGNAGTGQLAES